MSIYKEGQLVWAKSRGYNWWPAKVMESNEKTDGQISKEVKVEFIGEGKRADISISKLDDFQEKYSQHSSTKNQKLIDILKTIPRVPFLQLSQGHENGSLNFTFDSILLDSKSDVSEGENHYYPHKSHFIEIPSLSQPSNKKTRKSNRSLQAVGENKSLNTKRNGENRQESIISKPIFRCSYETIPDLIQGESGCWQLQTDTLIDPPFYNSHQRLSEEELREFAHSDDNSSEHESAEEEDEDEDYEVIQKKLKVDSSKNKPRGRGKRAKIVPVKEPVVVVRKDKDGTDVKSKSGDLIEGLVKRLLEMYENNKIQLIEEGQNYRGFSSASFQSKNKEEPENKEMRRMVESMRDLLSQVIIWLTENLEGLEKITLINLIYDIVDGAIQGSIPFFQQLKSFFLTTYEFLLKNKQLTNIMDNNMISSIIDLVHEVDPPADYDEQVGIPVPVPHIPNINEKENAKCESVNHVERSTRKASGTSSESNSNIAEHMTEKEQEEEQSLDHYEEVNYEELMENVLLRRSVCQKFAKLFQKLYKISSDTAQDLILLVEGRIQSFFLQNIESYIKSIRILYKLVKMKVVTFKEIETIIYMEFGDFKELLENKIHRDDFSFQTEVVLNIQPGYSSLVLDDEIEMI